MKKTLRNIMLLITMFSVAYFYVGIPLSYAALGSKSTLLSGAQYWGLQSGSQSGINLPSGSSVTVSVWLYPTVAFTSGNQFGMGPWGTSGVPPVNNGPNSNYLLLIQTTPLIILDFAPGGCGVTATIPTNQWSLITGTYNTATGNGNFYVNTTQQGTTQACGTGAVSGDTAQMNIGYEVTNSAYFTGNVWDARIYKAELSSAQITSYFNNPCTFSSAGLNLEGEWAFNGDGTDLSGNANTLTNNGSATFSATPAVPAVCSSGTIFNFSLFDIF